MTEITETQDTIENEQPILEGEYQFPQQKVRLFNTMTALTDYINVFKINNGRFDQGTMNDTGRTVYQLTYIGGE